MDGIASTRPALRARLGAWRQWPRETRDTLFQLVLIGWTVLPHLTHLAPWCGALTAVVLLWRAQLALASGPLPSRWKVALVLALAVALTAWTERTLLGKEAGVTLLVLLMALKTLELRARRDAMVIFFLGFFLVLTHCLYSQSLLIALHMLLATWGLLTALVLANMPVGKPPLKRAAYTPSFTDRTMSAGSSSPGASQVLLIRGSGTSRKLWRRPAPLAATPAARALTRSCSSPRSTPRSISRCEPGTTPSSSTARLPRPAGTPASSRSVTFVASSDARCSCASSATKACSDTPGKSSRRRPS